MRLVARLATIEEEIEQIRAISKGDSQSKNLEGPFKKRTAAQAALEARRREAQPQVQAYVERKTAEERAASFAKLKTDKVLLEDRAKTLSAEMRNTLSRPKWVCAQFATKGPAVPPMFTMV